VCVRATHFLTQIDPGATIIFERAFDYAVKLPTLLGNDFLMF
jgi:hypothetical protein